MSSNNWPAPLDTEAFYGIAGDFVNLVESETEADRNILLILFLVFAGNIFGRHAWFEVSGQRHYPNVFLGVVGATGEGRKGTATAAVDVFFRAADHHWTETKIVSGLSSGEGLIEPIRDARSMMVNVAKKGEPPEFNEVETDPGVSDKRLLVSESELAGALASMKREGNKLSVVMRDAFDSKQQLGNLTKKDKTTATNPHISIVANITQQELKKQMLTVEMFNGFANRFMWALSRRSKRLPEGGQLGAVAQGEEFRALVRRFCGINGVYRIIGADPAEDAKFYPHTEGRSAVIGEAPLSDEAQDLWGRNGESGGMYEDLEPKKHGMHSAVTYRAAAITRRLALIYCLLDGCNRVTEDHLLAAREVWRYCDDSARLIFNGEDDLGNEVATKILKALQESPNYSMGSTEISRLFSNHLSADDREKAQEILVSRGKATVYQIPGTKTRIWKLAA